MTERPTRSDSYQYLLLEIVCSNEMMAGFSNDQSLYDCLNPYAYDDEMMELKEQLKIEFWKLVDNYMTENQKKILHLYADGYTQQEIAKMLNVNRSSITKSINGNTDYKNGARVYGGSRKKLKKLAKHTPRIQQILARLQEIQDNKW